MSILQGLGIGLVFFLCFFIGFILGKRERPVKVDKPEITDEQRKKAEKVNTAFSKLMAYDVQTAMQKKKVI